MPRARTIRPRAMGRRAGGSRPEGEYLWSMVQQRARQCGRDAATELLESDALPAKVRGMLVALYVTREKPNVLCAEYGMPLLRLAVIRSWALRRLLAALHTIERRAKGTGHHGADRDTDGGDPDGRGDDGGLVRDAEHHGEQ